MRTQEKASTGAIREASESNNLITFGGNQKGFDVSDYAPKNEKTQCHRCFPPLVKPRGAAKLCPHCEAETRRTAEMLLDNFARHRKVIKLDCFCFACDARKTAALMHKLFPICRKCFDDLKSKSATAQVNLINRAMNNFLKGLKRAVTV